MRKSPTNIQPKDQATAQNAAITSQIQSAVKSSGIPFEQEIGVESLRPRGNRVLIRRIEEPSLITITDAPKSIKGVILSCGPKVDMVRPGMTVLFNSKWNDLSHAENKGTGADGSGPLERPLSYKLDPLTHLVTEDDIFCILPDASVKALLGKPTLEREYFVNRAVSGPWSEA